jgi:capsular polysaccharide transport system permease protein
MNDAHREPKSAASFPTGATGAHAVEHFVLGEDLRRVSVPIDQFGSWRWLILSFALCVLGAMLCASLYYGLIASDQYAVEFRFSVRSAGELGGDEDVVKALTRKGNAHDIGRLPYVVANYLRSRNVVRELDRNAALRTMFSRVGADRLSRFDRTTSEDALWAYWQGMMTVNVDRVSGLILVRVRAFTPEDAFDLAKDVARATETMIDGVAARARRDAVYLAEEELERASLRYSDALRNLRDLQNQEGTVDPQLAIDASATTLLGVIREKLALERQHDANLKVVSASAPQQRALASQIQALESQTAALTEALTSRREDVKSAAQTIARFESGELERRFSERLLEVAQAGYERARLEAERQHVYLALFVEPKKPTSAEFPRRLRLIAFVGTCAFGLWSVIMLTLAGVRDHWDKC